MGAVRRIRRSVKRVVQQRDSGSQGQPANNINVADPSNVAISSNTDGRGNVQAVSSRQRVRIRQDGDGTYEESETIETRR